MIRVRFWYLIGFPCRWDHKHASWHSHLSILIPRCSRTMEHRNRQRNSPLEQDIWTEWECWTLSTQAQPRRMMSKHQQRWITFANRQIWNVTYGKFQSLLYLHFHRYITSIGMGMKQMCKAVRQRSIANAKSGVVIFTQQYTRSTATAPFRPSDPNRG